MKQLPIHIWILILSTLVLSACQKQGEHLSRDQIATLKPTGMVWIPPGSFEQGAVTNDPMALAHEMPRRPVDVAGFFMDITEVTNAQFARFVSETGYVTIAERAIDWDSLKKQLPKDTPKPPDSLLAAGSLTFHQLNGRDHVNLNDYSQWWKITAAAYWKQPHGPNSSINGKENYPVVHIAFEDAKAYCKWAGRRLPTEAEWEYAARAHKETVFTWGNDLNLLYQHANTWEGQFPIRNTRQDGFEGLAPVKSYPANDFALYDMAGNVWEWTSDRYTGSHNHMTESDSKLKQSQKVIKGGSFLCNASYCASYRVSARMSADMNSPAEHLGFRTVATIEMLQARGN